MGVQEKDWGSIQWMENGNDGLFQKGLNVGIVTLRCGAHQRPHTHYEEQVFYVIHGQATSIINGESVEMTPGQFFRWPAGVIHEIFNTGDIPFQHLLISNPTSIDLDNLQQEKKISGNLTEEELDDLFFMAIEAVRTQFLEMLNYSYVIFDRRGEVVLESKYRVEFCATHCKIDKKRGSFPCTPCPEDEQCRSERARICPRGLTVYDVPVFFGGYFLGHIQGGYIYQSQQSGVVLEDVYDAPESSAIGLLNLLRKIAKAIRNYCEFEEFRRELVDRELKLNTSREKQRLLISSLKKAEYEVADLKINNHFLFNTLNGMASMALDGGQMTLYQSIVNLSKLFHYTLQNQQTIVPLKKEMEFLRAYLQLQKLRYGENLQIDCSEGENLGEEPVPFNFLQPIVENAFTHGFVNENEKKLNVVINKVNDRLEITISNTGEHLEENTCLAINKAMQGTTSHGMSMIYNKLAANYGEDFRFQIEPGAENGACVRISIPAFLAGKGR